MLFNSTALQMNKQPLDFRWAHAVNSKQAAIHAMHNNSINAWEADVIYSRKQEKSVMGHPPMSDNTFTLEDYLAMVNVPINKLDFKSEDAAFKAKDVLEKYVETAECVVFLNADILKGPCHSIDCEPKFNADAFVKYASTFPGIVLSPGWTTSSDTDPYTEENVREMLRVLKPYPKMRVTFPIRATLFRSSWKVLKVLLDTSDRYGFTLWWSKSILDEQELEYMYDTLEGGQYRDRTYYDIVGFESFYSNKNR